METKTVLAGSRTGRRIFVCALITAFACLAAGHVRVPAQTCSLDFRAGASNSQFDSIFTQNGPGNGLEAAGIPGWTGSDSTYSIELPNGDSAFFFSDSYIGESPAKAGDGTVTTDASGLRTRASNCGPPLCDPPTNLYHAHNSVVVRNALTGTLTTLTGPPDLINGYATSYFAPPDAAITNHFYWMGDSAVVQTDAIGTKKLFVFLMQWDNSFTYYGSAVAQLSLPSMQIDLIQPVGNLPTTSNINWGSALWLDGGFGSYTLYIYGMKMTGTQKRPYLAKTNVTGSLLDIANSANWTYWNGAGWSVNALDAAPVIGNVGDPNNAADSISDEYSVKKLHTASGDSYVLVGMDTTAPFGAWKDVTLYTACQPQGPFSAKTVVYSAPEAGSNLVPGMAPGQTLAGTILVYNPHLHPQFTSKGKLLVSYDLNAGKSQDLLYADTYRPRFVSVPVKGLR
jgi:hypothetical protein